MGNRDGAKVKSQAKINKLTEKIRAI